MKKLTLTLVTLFLFTSFSAQADRMDRRQLRQQHRIHQGVKSGELTRKEAKRLRKGQRHMKRMEHRMKKDGEVTPQEQARTYAVQDETGKFIRRDDNQEKRHVIERLRCNLASHIANLDRVSVPRRTVVYTYQPHIEDLAKNNGFEIENIDFVYSK